MWLVLQADVVDDYVIATGETHSLRDLLDLAFARVGIEDWSHLVRQDPGLFRPAEVTALVGDAAKARELLRWAPIRSFKGTIDEMVDSDIRDVRAAELDS